MMQQIHKNDPFVSNQFLKISFAWYETPYEMISL